jgi:hypothetical protein
VVGPHGDRVVEGALAGASAQVTAAVDLVAGQPSRWDARSADPAEHRGGELRLGGELDRFGDTRQIAAFVVGAPVLRQEQGAVDQISAWPRGAA